MPTTKQITNDFVDRVGTDGLYDLKRATNIIVRLIWLTLLIAAWVVVIIQSVAYIRKYFQYPVDTNVELKFDSEAYFPAVTICNLNTIKQKHAHFLEKLAPDLDGLLEQTPPNNQTMKRKDWDDTITDHGNIDNRRKIGTGEEYWSPDEVPEEELIRTAFFNAYFKMTDYDKEQYGHQMNEMLVECTWKQKQCFPSNFTMFLHPTYGVCHTFNAGWKPTGAQGSTVDTTIERTSLPGPSEGLSVQLYAQSNEYVPLLASSIGFRVLIHSQASMPLPEDTGFTISAGFTTALELRKVEIGRMPLPYSGVDCHTVFGVNSVLAKGFWPPANYTMAACMKMCYQQQLEAECGCIDSEVYYFSSKTNIHGCNIESEEGYCKREFDVEFRRGNKGSVCHSMCPQACAETDYEVQISSAQWPNQYYLEILKDTTTQRNTEMNAGPPGDLDDEIRKNMVKLDVYYQSLNYKSLTESEGYNFLSLLADLGGAADLWVGMSILAMCQCIEYFIELCFNSCGSSSSKVQSHVRDTPESQRHLCTNCQKAVVVSPPVGIVNPVDPPETEPESVPNSPPEPQSVTPDPTPEPELMPDPEFEPDPPLTPSGQVTPEITDNDADHPLAPPPTAGGIYDSSVNSDLFSPPPAVRE